MKKSDFRNNPKCFFDDSGFCKYAEKCRKQHSKSICLNQKCDKKCTSRHPKPCKYEDNCKFFAKQICAFKHVTRAYDDIELVTLKQQIESLKLKNENMESQVIKLDKEITNLNEFRLNLMDIKLANLEEELKSQSESLKYKDDDLKELSKQNEIRVKALEMKVFKLEEKTKHQEKQNQEICELQAKLQEFKEASKLLETGKVEPKTSKLQQKVDEKVHHENKKIMEKAIIEEFENECKEFFDV